MLERIRQMFVRPKRSDESRTFIGQLAKSRIWILAVGLRGIPSIPDPNDPAAVDIIAEHRIDVSEIGDDDAVFPFNFELNGKQTLPFFSSEQGALAFASDKSIFSPDVTVFQPCRLQAGFVTSPENDDLQLVLDPGTSSERILTSDERRLLRSLTAE